MLKYVNTKVTFAEVPGEIALCIEISGCQIHCKGCHSQHLWEDIGEELWPAIGQLILKNPGISCVCLMGGGIYEIKGILEEIKHISKLKTAWYTGETLEQLQKEATPEVYSRVLACLDFLKVGPYLEECGPLTEPTTNQRFYAILQPKAGTFPATFRTTQDVQQVFTFQDKTELFYNKKLNV